MLYSVFKCSISFIVTLFSRNLAQCGGKEGQQNTGMAAPFLRAGRLSKQVLLHTLSIQVAVKPKHSSQECLETVFLLFSFSNYFFIH